MDANCHLPPPPPHPQRQCFAAIFMTRAFAVSAELAHTIRRNWQPLGTAPLVAYVRNAHWSYYYHCMLMYYSFALTAQQTTIAATRLKEAGLSKHVSAPPPRRPCLVSQLPRSLCASHSAPCRRRSLPPLPPPAAPARRGGTSQCRAGSLLTSRLLCAKCSPPPATCSSRGPSLSIYQPSMPH